MTKKIGVLLIDDHALFRSGVKALLPVSLTSRLSAKQPTDSKASSAALSSSPTSCY